MSENNKLNKEALNKVKDLVSGKSVTQKESEQEERLTIEKARAILLHNQPFFACMLQACRFRWDDRVGTAGVRVNSRGQVELVVSPKFWNSLDGYQGVGLLMHEMLHILNEHLTRGVELHPYIANLAMDIAINQYIPDNWLPKGALLPEMKEQDKILLRKEDGSIVEIPNPNAGKLIWKLEEKKAFEIYYAELIKLREKLQEQEKNGQQQTMDNHDWQKDGGQQGEQSQGQGQQSHSSEKGDKERGQDQKDGSGNPSDKFKGKEQPKDGDGQVSDDVQKIAIDQLIRKAAEDAKNQFPGKTPSHVEQAIMDRFKPAKVDWRRALRNFMGRKHARNIESTRTKPNRRFGITIPGYRKTYTPSILIAVDCSGSVRDEWYVTFMSEIKEILKGQDEKTEVVFFDTELCKQKFKLSDLKEMPRRPACGGTNFQPVVDYANEKKPDLLIVFTDGDAYSPSKPSFSVLWALIGANNGEHLTGKKIFIDEKDLSKKGS